MRFFPLPLLPVLAALAIAVVAAGAPAPGPAPPPDSPSPASPSAAAHAAPPAADPSAPRQLDTVNVAARRYQPLAPALPNYLGFLARPALPAVQSGNLSLGFPNRLGAVVVTAARTPQPPAQVAASVRLLDEAALRRSPAATLDGALREVPGFSLFRRSDSLSANPTAQGVSLRGLGPSGASRSLVLLDGVPLNDPFGGWVAWSKLPREGLGQAEVLPGGGASAWGNAALGGIVHLFSLPVRTELNVVDRPPAPIGWIDTGSLRFAATLGDYGTRSFELAVNAPAPAGTAQLLGRTFATDGFALVAPERRGPVDVPAWSRHRWASLRWRGPLAQKLELLATARAFAEKRGNGTPYQRNASREHFASLALAGQPADRFGWHAVAYVQDQSFASTFGAVNAARTAETPASDQFAVPSFSVGAAWTGTLRHAGRALTSFGTDTRFVRGETREHFAYVSGRFTRLRVAGGEQRVAGLFAVHERPLSGSLRATLGARADRSTDTAGLRRESDRFTGALARDDRYADHADTHFSPSAGLVWTPAPAWRVRAHAQNSFRRPTLNELYRPFRAGANVTEANPALRTERAASGELGAEWTLLGPPGPRNVRSARSSQPSALSSRLVLGLTAFANDLRDAVANVTVARGPGTFPVVGPLAAGGLGRQRLNLDRIRVQGLELSARWTPLAALTVNADALLNDASVRRAAVAPALVGKRVAQVPRRSGSLGVTWLAPGKFTVVPRLRYLGRQFEDDENQLVLGAAVVADLGVSRQLTANLEFFISAENLGNTRLETGRSADGIVNVGTPRLVSFGLRGRW